jgi:ParB/RepB/Spo0J family partition protein
MPRTPATAAAAKKAAAAKLPPPEAVPVGAEHVVVDAPAPKPPAKKAAASRPPAAAPAVGSVGVVEVPLALIDDSTRNPRETLPGLPGLAKSIEARGLLQLPKVIATGDGRYRIVDGHRRCAAAKLAGLSHIRVDVEPADGPTEPIGEMVDRMVANLERADLTVMDEARGYGELKAGGMQQNQIAEAVNRNPGHVSKRLKLLGLPESLQALVDLGVDAGGISIEQGVDIARLPGKVQVAIAETLERAPKINAMGIEDVIRRKTREHEQTTEIVAVVKELRAGKSPVLNVEGDTLAPPPTFNRTDGPAPLYQLGLDDAEHAKLDCHAVVLLQQPSGGGEGLVGRWTVTVCTDPAAHRPAIDAVGKESGPPPVPVKAASVASGPGPSATAHPPARQTKAEKEAAAARQQLNDDLEAAHAALTTFVSDICHGKVAAIMRDYVLQGQVRSALLNREWFLDGPQMTAVVANSEAGGIQGLVELADVGSGDRLVRAALAALLERDLETVDPTIKSAARGNAASMYAPDVVDTVAFYAFATTCGYEPTPVEAAALTALREAYPDPFRAALIEQGLIEEADPASDRSWHDRLREQGVTDAALQRAVTDGVPYDVWLEPGRDTPVGRCEVCHGPAKALTVGNAGRHAPGGGTVKKGAEACPGGRLMTIDAVAELEAAAPSAEGVDEVTCETCQGVGRKGDSTELCGDCGGRGMVAPAAALAEAATG